MNLINSEEAIGEAAHDELAVEVRDIMTLNNLSCPGVFGGPPTPVR